MGLKVAIAQAAARSGTGTQDFTDSGAGFSSDVKVAIFIGSNATAADTATGQGHLRFGVAASTGDTQATFATISRTATTTYAAMRSIQTALCYTARTGSTTPSSEAAIDSWLSNGIRINWTNASDENELITALLLGGDIEAKVVSATWASETTKTISHGLSGAPEIIIALSAIAFGAQCSLGFWATGGTYGYANLYAEHNVATTNVFSAANTNGCAAVMTTGTVNRYFTISNVGASTFDCTASASWTSGNLAFLCIRGTSAALVAKAGAFTTKTGSTGTDAEVTGMAAAPQVLLTLPTLLTSLGTLSNDSNYGIVVACNRAGTTQYGGSVLIEDDGITPTTAPPYSRTTADSALVIMATDGTEDVVATVDSWDSDGVTLNYSNIGASAFQIPYLAFGITAAGTKHLKVLTHASAAGVTSVAGTVFEEPGSGDITGAKIGEFTTMSFLGANSLDGGKAKLLVNVNSFGGSALTTADAPVVYVRTTSFDTGIIPATVVEI